MPSPNATDLTIDEAAAALSAMAAGRRDMPSRNELRAMVTARNSGMPPKAAKLFAEIESATARAKRSADPIALAVAEMVSAVMDIARQQIEAR